MRLLSLVVLSWMIALTPAFAQTPAEAYQRGCANCHRSENTVLRHIPKRDEAARRAWIEAFMAQHPCERDDLKELIVTYLLDRSRP
jgi:hypothetical protein